MIAVAETPTTVTPDKLTAARIEVERLCQVERDWSARRRQLASDIADLVSRSGDLVLDAALDGDAGATSGALSSRLAAMRAEVEAVESTIAASRRRRSESIPTIAQCEAEQLRQQAVELRDAATEREPKTAELLAALQEWEGCTYAPTAPQRGSGPVSGAIGGAPAVVMVSTPRTLELRQQADILDRQALEVDRRQPVTSGMVTADDFDGIEAAIFADPMRMGPPMSDVEVWFASATAAQRSCWARHRATGGEDYAGSRITYTLSWRNATIWPEQSAPALGR
jgi:hypothetical protein